MVDHNRSWGWASGITLGVFKRQEGQLGRTLRTHVRHERIVEGVEQFDQDIVTSGRVSRYQVGNNYVFITA